MKASSRPQLSLNKITNSNNFSCHVISGCILRKTVNFGRYINWLLVMTIVHPHLPPFTIITHSVKRRQSVELGHRWGSYVCTGAQGLLLCWGPGSEEVLRKVPAFFNPT
ncbi:hypothetical protein TNCV_3870431 [Trichonephila clavipes]|nr:hypothetical protein TNCV_3870431 [Trichonephila clavipes]